jgi:hypothetical protein
MKLLFLVAIFLFSTILKGQNPDYTPPLKIPLLLSGSFAELRSNHFHSGIDIKTQGVTGLPVFSVADGYVSRIVISPSGYGKAVYIDHPNGTTSVYGHLNNFRKDISEYIKNFQYKKQSYRVDIAVAKNRFPVKQGDEIAKSGNTGSSGGPHLHFEIRNTETEEPLNPLKYNFPVTDNTAPKIFSLMVAPVNELSHVNFQNSKKIFPVVFYDGKYHLKGNPVIPVYGNIGFAVHANDYFDNSWNKCGVYSLELIIDDEVWLAWQHNKFSFDETRYINSFIDYEEYIRSGNRYQKTWKDPGNRLSVYSYEKNQGVFTFDDNDTHSIQLILKDTYGNSSVLECSVKSSLKEITVDEKPFTERFDYRKRNEWRAQNFRMAIPEGALYTHISFEYNSIPADPDLFSNLHIVHKNTTPLHKNTNIQIKPIGLPKHLEPKALLVNVDTLTGKFYTAGGNLEDGWLVAEIRNFGNYAVAVDTVSPEIVPLSITSNNTLTESNRIRFKISDQLAGIEKYEGFIDGKWALFEYDPRTEQITHYFDPERFEMGKNHTLLLRVTDYKQNTATYEATFVK